MATYLYKCNGVITGIANVLDQSDSKRDYISAKTIQPLPQPWQERLHICVDKLILISIMAKGCDKYQGKRVILRVMEIGLYQWPGTHCIWLIFVSRNSHFGTKCSPD